MTLKNPNITIIGDIVYIFEDIYDPVRIPVEEFKKIARWFNEAVDLLEFRS